MIELGVALTWGVRVLVIKAQGCPLPPSDISGHTWVEYRDSGAIFVAANHDRNLLSFVRQTIQFKAP